MNAINEGVWRFIVVIGLIGSLIWTPREALARSIILVGRKATLDGPGLYRKTRDGIWTRSSSDA